MLTLRRLATSLALLLCAAAQAQVAVPPLRGHVTDLTGTLDASQAAALEQRLADFERRKGSQIAVLIVPTTQPETIEQYGIRVADTWKLGRKNVDDGAILIVAKTDRSLRIEVGYGLEGALNDVTCKRIIEEVIVPRFHEGRFGEGIGEGVDRILGVVSGEPLPPPRPEGSYQGLRRPGNPLWVLLVFAWFGAGVLRSVFGRPLGATLAGAFVGVLVWSVTGVVLYGLGGAVLAFLLAWLGGLPGGGWGGGGWRSGGISGGGYSGGGGGFGGGGASGRW